MVPAPPRFHLHFTPTYSSWLNLVERWFAELTTRKLRRSAHRSVADLESDITAWIQAWNEDPRPFVWTKTADEILDNLARYLHLINKLGTLVRQIIDVLVATRRDANAAHRLFEQAIGVRKVTPVEVTTDQAPTYPGILGELLPTAWHRTEQYDINRVEANHGRLKARLRPMRGLKRERFGRVPAVGEAVEVDDWRIEVLAVQRRAITRLRLVPLQAAQRRSGDQPTPE